MSRSKPAAPDRRPLGLLFLGAGLLVVLVALGEAGGEGSPGTAPPFVLLVFAGIFLSAGVLLMVREDSRAFYLLAALLALSLGVVGAWAALFAPSGSFSFDLTFGLLGLRVNPARVVFGAGALGCLATAAVSLWQAVQAEA